MVLKGFDFSSEGDDDLIAFFSKMVAGRLVSQLVRTGEPS